MSRECCLGKATHPFKTTFNKYYLELEAFQGIQKGCKGVCIKDIAASNIAEFLKMRKSVHLMRDMPFNSIHMCLSLQGAMIYLHEWLGVISTPLLQSLASGNHHKLQKELFTGNLDRSHNMLLILNSRILIPPFYVIHDLFAILSRLSIDKILWYPDDKMVPLKVL